MRYTIIQINSNDEVLEIVHNLTQRAMREMLTRLRKINDGCRYIWKPDVTHD